MHRLWPTLSSTSDPTSGLTPDLTANLAELTDRDLERIYDYPADLERPWVQVNFVSSADGAVTVNGHSEGLSSPADKRVFHLGRQLADVILVGANTVRVEGYRGVRFDADGQERRSRLGLSPSLPIAIVSRTAAIDLDAPIFQDTSVPPIMLTCAQALRTRLDALERQGVAVVVAGEEKVDLNLALNHLAQQGLRRVNCEGGPNLFGQLIAEDLVDQLCLTISPFLAGGGVTRIATGEPSSSTRKLTLASILHEDGYSMLRYRRNRSERFSRTTKT